MRVRDGIAALALTAAALLLTACGEAIGLGQHTVEFQQPSGSGSVEAPTISLPSGTYTTRTTATISTVTSGATIYYTSDGSDPKTSATRTAGASGASSATYSVIEAGDRTITAVAMVSSSASPEVSAAYTVPYVVTQLDPKGDGSTDYWQRVSSDGSGKYRLAVAASIGSSYVSSDYGATWSKPGVLASVTSAPSLCAMSPDGTYMMVGFSGTGGLYYSQNSGVGWTQATGFSVSSWGGLAATDNGGLMLASGSGSLRYSLDHGSNWMPDTDTNVQGGGSVGASSDGSYIVSTSGGTTLAVYQNAGNGYVANSISWATPSIPVSSVSWGKVAVSGDGAVMAATASSSYPVIVSSDHGSTWSDVSPITSAIIWNGIQVSSDGTRIIVVSNSGALYYATYSAGSWTWTSLPSSFTSGLALQAVACDSTGKDLTVTASPGYVYDIRIP